MVNLELRPMHYAAVSGGKDSLYMLGLVLKNLDKYPLDFVIHYQLEIDWDWAERVVNRIEQMCKSANIPFYRVCPRTSWYELFKKYSFSTRRVRWCNSKYKLDAERQVSQWVKEQKCRPICYIGFCADETKRFKYLIGDDWTKLDVCYPLAEEGIQESTVLEWAKEQPIFEDWYKYFRRQGCKFCPMISLKELAYMYKYEPSSFEFYFQCIEDYERRYNTLYFKPYTAECVKNRVLTKWLSLLEYEENQLSIDDYLKRV